MMQISSELLAMSGEAALLVKNGKVAFSNKSAQNLLGSDCNGKTVRSLLGEELAGVQSPVFIGDISIGKMHYTVRVSSGDGVKAFFISPENPKESLINDAFFFSLRNCMMNLKLVLCTLQQSQNLYPDIQELISQVCHEYFKLHRTISNISTVRAILDDSQMLSPVPLDLSAHISDTVDSLNVLLPESRLHFESTGSVNVSADPALIDIMLLNIISNALIHSGASSRINLSLSQSRNKVIISVEDNGCGIAADKMHEVFNRYRHVHGLDNMGFGAGLGIMAARLIAGIHGGTLMLESREGQGTAVHVSISAKSYSSTPINQELNNYDKNMETLLSGLADCLPTEVFSEKFID